MCALETMRLYIQYMSVSVMQAGATCTNFLLTTQLESGDWRKRTRVQALGRGSFSAVATFKLCS